MKILILFVAAQILAAESAESFYSSVWCHGSHQVKNELKNNLI